MSELGSGVSGMPDLLPPDRQLDRRVALALFGRPAERPSWWWWRTTGFPLDEDAALYAGPHFWTRWEDAATLIDRLAELGWTVQLTRDPDPAASEVEITRWERIDGEWDATAYHSHSGPDLAHNLCVVALKAVGRWEGGDPC